MISQTPFVVVDLETTGLEPGLDRIIEIGAVKVLNGEVIGEWNHLVNPGIFVPQEVTSITGITTEMVREAPPLERVAAEYLKFLDANAVFVAHNVDFDRVFLNHHLARLDFPTMENPYLCTFRLAKQVHPNLSKYSLGALAKLFDVDLPHAHRALHDARATAHLFIKFMKVLQDGGLKQLKDIPCIQRLPVVSNEVQGQVSLF